MDDIDFKKPVKHTGRELVEVVRCKDCIYYLNMDKPKSLPCRITEKHPDWFCADGKRALK